ncbi:MAG: metallopeptidase family protein [bacterium]|nr:metallopeptidase family protein [bacterium]
MPSMEKQKFESLVEDGFVLLPEWVRKKIKNVAILVEDEPSREIREQERLADDETLLGLYQGIPLSARGENYGIGMTMPDTITLYQKPIEEAALDMLRVYETRNFEEAVRKVIADTIWHEFAHHFGMDEGEVREREKGRQ